jgi:hypothetical protein
MFTNVNLAAPLGVLGFLATAVLLGALVLVLIFSLALRKFSLARLLIGGLAGIAVSYLGLMLLFSVASSATILARGQEKHFCEIDCHLAYSVQDVRQAKTLGTAPHEKTAAGIFYVVTIKTRFDETTISARRGNGLLYPNPRSLAVVDESGHRYPPAVQGENAPDQSLGTSTPIKTPLRPGEAYTTTFVFDLPAGISKPVLLINESDWITHLIIGHENSLLHRKTTFQI